MSEAEDTDSTPQRKLNVRDLDVPADGKCFVAGCAEWGTSLAMCRKHYMRWYKFGHPLAHGGERYDLVSDRVYKPKMRERQAWLAMLDRCSSPKSRNWHLYGARGIKVCKRWQDDFEAFYADMGPKPNGTSLERKDLHGDYEPGNCVWATVAEQNRNSRNVCLSVEIVGIAKGRHLRGEKVAAIAKDLRVSKYALYQALAGKSWKDVDPVHGT